MKEGLLYVPEINFTDNAFANNGPAENPRVPNPFNRATRGMPGCRSANGICPAVVGRSATM